MYNWFLYGSENMFMIKEMMQMLTVKSESE